MEVEKKLVRVERIIAKISEEHFESLTEESKRQLFLGPLIGFVNMVGLAKGTIEEWQMLVGKEPESIHLNLIALVDVISDEGFSARLDHLESLRFDQSDQVEEFVDKLFDEVMEDAPSQSE